MNIQKLEKKAVHAAIEAGKYLNLNKNSIKKIISNKGRDIKIELDKKTESLIRKELSETKISILGEEMGGKKTDEIYWVVDPIDGTANYFRGLDQCCVSIALMKGKMSLIGVIYNFNNNDLYRASKGSGAYLNDKKIKVSDIKTRSEASLTTGFPASESIESSLDFLKDLAKWKKIRMFGSAALSCAYVASGKCDYYAEKGVYLWDFAAGLCIVEEAGGKIEYKSLDGQRYSVKFSNKFL